MLGLRQAKPAIFAGHSIGQHRSSELTNPHHLCACEIDTVLITLQVDMTVACAQRYRQRTVRRILIDVKPGNREIRRQERSDGLDMRVNRGADN
ncbi:hypothetical protein DVS77_08805 [Mycolicibacterium moriokaense]|nr:hypothetical protein DVS77_08805 [Mycolicibacterium moriokaense]